MIVNLHPSQAEIATGTSPVSAIGNLECWALFVKISAVSGTLPTLVVKLQHSPNNIDWYDVPNLVTNTLSTVMSAQISLTGTQSLLADYIRCAWTISGTNPSLTFTADLLCRPL